MKLTIGYEKTAESPAKEFGWEIYSFDSTHKNFLPPNKQLPSSMGLKLESKKAFWLSYDKNEKKWELYDEIHMNKFAGILIWKDTLQNFPEKNRKERIESARSFLKLYTSWFNGENYFYDFEDNNGHFTHHARNIIGTEYLNASIKSECLDLFANDVVLEVEGEAKKVFKRAV